MSMYVLSYALAFIALVLWFYRQEKAESALFRNLLIGGLLAYGATLAFADAPVVYRLQILLRDLLFLGIFGTAFSFLAGKRVLGFIALLFSLTAIWFYSKQVTSYSFPYRQNIPLDQQGELLLEVKEGHQIAELDRLARQYGLRWERAFYPRDAAFTDLDNYYVVNVPDTRRRELPQIMRRLARNPNVAWVEENEQIQAEPLIAKPAQNPIADKFGLNDPGVENLWCFRQMNMDQSYNYLNNLRQKPQRKAVVAILDTGVDSKHEDIKGNFRSIKSEYDNDPKGHGTHCAGIAGAVSNNGVGIASYSRDNAFVEISSIKVLNSSGFGTQKTIVDGMILAADRGVAVISMSLGGPSNQTRQRAYESAVKYAQRAGVIVVAAAGNSNRNAKEFTPANAPGVICVSAVDAELNRAEFSNYVQDVEMAVAAPGVNIYSTIPDNKYATYNGTSMATPYVSGLVGLMKSLKPDLTAQEAYRILNETGKETRSTNLTGKFIQPAPAVKRLIEGQ